MNHCGLMIGLPSACTFLVEGPASRLGNVLWKEHLLSMIVHFTENPLFYINYIVYEFSTNVKYETDVS